MPHPRKTLWVSGIEIHWPLIHDCNTAPVSECRSCMTLILYGQSFESFTALLAEDYDNPLWKANKHKYFVGLVSIWTPMASHSSQLKHVFIFPFCSAWNLFPLFCRSISFIYMALLTQYILQNFFCYWKWPLFFNRINFTSMLKKCDWQENCPFHLLKCQQQNDSHSFGKQTCNFLC